MMFQKKDILQTFINLIIIFLIVQSENNAFQQNSHLIQIGNLRNQRNTLETSAFVMQTFYFANNSNPVDKNDQVKITAQNATINGDTLSFTAETKLFSTAIVTLFNLQIKIQFCHQAINGCCISFVQLQQIVCHLLHFLYRFITKRKNQKPIVIVSSEKVNSTTKLLQSLIKFSDQIDNYLNIGNDCVNKLNNKFLSKQSEIISNKLLCNMNDELQMDHFPSILILFPEVLIQTLKIKSLNQSIDQMDSSVFNKPQIFIRQQLQEIQPNPPKIKDLQISQQISQNMNQPVINKQLKIYRKQEINVQNEEFVKNLFGKLRKESRSFQKQIQFIKNKIINYLFILFQQYLCYFQSQQQMVCYAQNLYFH